MRFGQTHMIGILAAVLLVAPACGKKSNSPTSPSGSSSSSSGTVTQGTMTASINGTSWTSVVPAAVQTGGFVSLAGSDGVTTLAFLVAATSPGTYTIPGTGSGIGNNALITVGGASWTATFAQGSGTVKIDTLTSTSATGSFSFTLTPSSGGATGTKTVTGGAFNVKF